MEKQNQSRIVPVSLGRANAYFVVTQRQALLIDTGEKGNEGKIVEAAEKLGLSPSDIGLIIVTHTHYDHCGSMRALKDLTGARVLVHQHEAMCLREGYGGFPKGTTGFTRVISLVGRGIGKRIGGYEPVSPDIVISERFGLEEYGTDGYILPTPGHTTGSISVILGNGHAIVGDTLFNIFRKSVFPPFADDQEELLRSWGKLIDAGCRTFYPGHGSPLGIGRLMQSLETRKRGRRPGAVCWMMRALHAPERGQTLINTESFEGYEQRYRLKAQGFDLRKVAHRVGVLPGMNPEEVFRRGKDRWTVLAHRLLCYWATEELEKTQEALAQRFKVTQPSISAAVRRGEQLVGEHNWKLVESNKL